MAKTNLGEIVTTVSVDSSNLPKDVKKALSVIKKYNRDVVKNFEKTSASVAKIQNKMFKSPQGKFRISKFKQAPHAAGTPRTGGSRDTTGRAGPRMKSGGFDTPMPRLPPMPLGQFTPFTNIMQGVAGAVSKAFSAVMVYIGAITKLATALKLAVVQAADFEESFAVVRAITSGSASDFKALEKSIMKVSAATEHSMGSLVSAAEVFGRAGFKASEIGEALDTVGKLASASGMEVAKAARLSIRMVKSFGLEMKELPRIANMLAAASANADVSIQSLGEGFKFAGAIAKSQGMQFSDMVTALSLLGETGLEAGLAGRALQAALMGMANPTSRAVDKMHELGIVTHSVDGKILPLVNILKQLKSRVKDNADVFKMFNSNAARAITTLMSVSDRYGQFQTDVETNTSALDHQSEIVREGLNKALDQLNNNLDVTRKKFGDPLLSPLTKITEQITKLVAAINSISVSKMVSFAAVLMSALPGVGPLLGQLMKGGFALSRDPAPKPGPWAPTGDGVPPLLRGESEEEEARRLRATTKAEALDPKNILADALEKLKREWDLAQVGSLDAIKNFDIAGKARTIIVGLSSEIDRVAGVTTPEAWKAAMSAMKLLMGHVKEGSVAGAKEFLLASLAVWDIQNQIIKEISAIYSRKADLLEKDAKSFQSKLGAMDPRAVAEIMPDLNTALNRSGVTEAEAAEAGDSYWDSIDGPASVTGLLDKGKKLTEAYKASDQVWDGLADSAISMTGKLGGLASDIGAASAGGPWAMLAAAVMNLMQETEGFGALMVPLNKIFEVLVTLIEPFMEPLFHVANLFAMIAETLGTILLPVFKFVAEVINMFAMGITGLANLFVGIVNIVIKLANFFGAGLEELEYFELHDTYEDTLEGLNDETGDATDNFSDLNDKLIESANVASGFKTNLRAFQAALNDSTATILGSSGSGGPMAAEPMSFHAGGVVPGVGNGDSVPAMLTPGETVIPRGGAAGGIVIQNMHVHVADTKDFMRKLTREREWQTLVRTGSPIKGKLYGAR